MAIFQDPPVFTGLESSDRRKKEYNMPKIPSLQDLLKAGVHFGHRTSRWHPKMEPFIFSTRGGIHVIDIEQTQKMLEQALKTVETITAQGGTVVFMGTKTSVAPIVERYAKEAETPYITNRWLGGTFTNFGEIQKLIKTYLDLQDKRDKGELKKYTKLEQLQFDRKIEELEEKIGGISTLKKLPDAIFVTDIRHDKTAVVEAKKCGVKVIGIVDTNINPAHVDMVIPANDDAIAGVQLITSLMSEAVREGRGKAKSARMEAASKVSDSDDVQVKADAKAIVDDIDDEVKEKLAREQAEMKK